MNIDVVVPDDGALTVTFLEERLQLWAGTRDHQVQLVAVPPATIGEAITRALAGADAVVVGASDALPAGRLGDIVGDHAGRVAVVDLDHHPAPPDEIDEAGIRRIHGRGIDTYRWAAQLLVAQLTAPATRHAYGSGPQQFGELRLPDGAGPHPVVVLVHGGFWHHYWALDLMDDMALDLTAQGYATWNLEYRRGPGAVEATLADVAAGVDHLRTLDGALGGRLDLDRVGLAGHSAGGHLVLWAAARARHGEPEAIVPAVCVPLAPVTDLRQCAARGMGDGAAREFMGGRPLEVPDRYGIADPMHRLPVGCPVTIVQGLADGVDLIDLGRVYARTSARHSDELTLVEVPDSNHFHVIDPTSAAWSEVTQALATRLLDEHDRPDHDTRRVTA